MLHFTIIARQSDALALAADTDTTGGAAADLERLKLTAKNVLRKLAAEFAGSSHLQPPLLTVESGSYSYHVLTEGGAMFLTLSDSSSPAALAFAYLEDVAREFTQQYGGQIAQATRPYTFIKFDTYLQKTKKVFSSASSARSASALQRANRPQVVRRTFREVMESESVSPTGGGRGGFPGTPAARSASSSSLTIACIALSIGTACAFVLLIIYLVMM
jgi:hypothetical protein